jgi:Arm DNA-binding domain
MTRHEYSASTLASASTLLPSAEVIPLPTARGNRPEPGTFTKVTVRKMQCPHRQDEKFFWDTACRGFGIRALRTGRRSWIFQYRDEHGRTRRIVLGDVSAVELDDARGAARRMAASVAQGSNPALTRQFLL